MVNATDLISRLRDYITKQGQTKTKMTAQRIPSSLIATLGRYNHIIEHYRNNPDMIIHNMMPLYEIQTDINSLIDLRSFFQELEASQGEEPTKSLSLTETQKNLAKLISQGEARICS